MEDIRSEITRLKTERNAIILAHYYQEPDIQDIADFVGDSLQLAQYAANTSAETIVFCGVHFMAETAKILNPNKIVLLPDLDAGCSLEQSCPPGDFMSFIDMTVKANPGKQVSVVSYINCSAAVKAVSDVICTSSNAKKIVESIPADHLIIFAPDKNLGRFVMKETGRDMILWDGACIVHEAFSIDKLLTLWQEHPGSKLVVHPEAEEHLVRIANFVGSTAAMINFVKTDPHEKFLIATEAGILHQMSKVVPHKTLIPVPSREDNTCACSECAFMKVNTLHKLYLCLKNGKPEIKMDEEIMLRAYSPIKKMLDLSK
jgi:quinolinate synthase